MTKTSRTDALRQADQIRSFRDELRRLEEENVLALSTEQQEAITQHYEALLAGQADGVRQPSIAISIAWLIAIVALVAITFLLLDPYWLLLPTPVQVALLIAASGSTLVLTFWLACRETIRHFATPAALLAFACFVVNVLQLSWILGITFTTMPLIPWAAYALLLAHGLKSRLLLVIGALCGITFVVVGVGAWGGYW